MAGSKRRFEDKPCLAIGRGLTAPIQPHILRDSEEIKMFREYAAYDLEFPWFTIMIIDNF